MYEYDTYKTKTVPLKLKKVRELPDIKMSDAKTVVSYMNRHFLMEEKTEEFLYAICLRSSGNVEGVFLVSRGTVNTTAASPVEILKRMLLLNTPCVIIVHNHPSGEPKPSYKDIDFNMRLYKLAKEAGINLTDSIIIGEDNNYYSARESGEI